MAALTNTAETHTANWLAGRTDAVAPTLPYVMALVTANGTDDTQGSEVSGGGYVRTEVAFTAAWGDTIANDALVRFENMPGVEIVGLEVYDSATTPIRWFYGALTTPRSLVSGDPVEFAAGALTIRLD